MIDLKLGDNLKVLKEYPDNYFDSVITDPPYGLSSNNSQQRINEIIRKGFDVELPNFYKSDPKSIQYSEFVGILRDCPFLSNTEFINGIEPPISMPKSSVNLNGDVVLRKEEIYTTAISSANIVSDFKLWNKFDTNGVKFIGNYVLDFGDSFDFSRRDPFSSNFCQLSSSFFRMPICSILSPLLPSGFCEENFLFIRNGVNDLVWGNNNSGCNPFGSSVILTPSTTKEIFVLNFFLPRGSDKNINATITTEKECAFPDFISPKLIRTHFATGSTPPMFEPVRIDIVINTANRTPSQYFFHVLLPKKIINSLSQISNNSKGFMGKSWDGYLPSVALWQEVLRVSKPGATLLSFGGSRTFHRLACTIEDAGWELFDVIMWVFGSGFPKSHNISKAIDREKGLERIEIAVKGKLIQGGFHHKSLMNDDGWEGNVQMITTPASDLAKLWDGWGSALKPAYEPIIVARKPNDGTFAENAEKWGVSGLWIDGARIETLDDLGRPTSEKRTCFQGLKNIGFNDSSKGLGRWPANLILDEESAKLLDKEVGKKTKSSVSIFPDKGTLGGNGIYGGTKSTGTRLGGHLDERGPSRFFYTAKASRSEREEGLEDFNQKKVNDGRETPIDNAYQRGETKRKNVHPTIKPIKLMEYLCKLTKTPTGGHVLDPFMGSGSAGIACLKTGRDFTGIEISEEYFKIAKARIEHWNPDAEKEEETQETEKKFKQGELF